MASIQRKTRTFVQESGNSLIITKKKVNQHKQQQVVSGCINTM